MLRSLFSGVAGLKTHQTKMDVIGNNIANVNTYGFKGSRVTFKDVYYQTIAGASNSSGNLGGSNPSQIGYGSSVGSIDLINTRSGFAATGNGMDCYIDGEGYFVIKDGAGNTRYTQVGTLSFDGDGNLVDGKKNFVCGFPVDPAKTSYTASVGTSNIDFGLANKTLDGYKVEVKYGDANSVKASKTNNTIVVTLQTDKTTNPPTLPTKENLETVLKGNWTWLAPDGKDSADAADVADGFKADDIKVIGLDNDEAKKQIATETTGKIAEKAGFKTAEPTKIIKTEALKSISIGADGVITGQNEAGKIVTVGQVCIADIPNPHALTQEGNSYFKAVNNTGTVTFHAPGDGTVGPLQSGGLETSNVDLANEFADMIITQRGFQANSKIITVGDEMLQELVNLKR